MSDLREQLLGPIEDVLETLTESGKARVEQLMLDIDDDLVALHTVPIDRQARYLARIEKQLLATLELERIELVGASRVQVVSVLSTLIRAVVAAI